MRGNLGNVGGNVFLVSQLDYLRHINCSRTEVQFICNEQFQQDWTRVTSLFGLHNASLVTANNRSSFIHDTGSALGPREARLWRECLYPWDAHLHAMLCTNRSLSRGSVGRST